MAAVYSLLIVLGLSFFLTRVATIALSLTGMSHDLARLQSISAFTGVGFTTTESETVVGHPVRRRILVALMVLGNAGVVTSISTLILSFTSIEQGQWYVRAGWILAGVAALWFISSSQPLERILDRFVRWLLAHTTSLHVIDYDNLLSVGEHWEVRRLNVKAGGWLEGQTLSQAELFQEGVLVLGIHRDDGEFVGIPRGDTEILAGDALVLYGRSDDISELDARRRGARGDAQHERAKRDQSEQREQQRRENDRRRGRRGKGASVQTA